MGRTVFSFDGMDTWGGNEEAAVRALGSLIWLLCVMHVSTALGETRPTWTVEGSNYTLGVFNHICPSIPWTSAECRNALSLSFAVMAANSGSEFFSYLRRSQSRIDWWPAKLVPTEANDSLVWTLGDDVVFRTADGPVPVCEWIAAYRCTVGSFSCGLARIYPAWTGRFSDIQVPAPGGRQIVVYLGTPRGRVVPESVQGVEIVSTDREPQNGDSR
jgi:hypothetical protein